MGIAVVLIFYTIALILAASVIAAVLGLLAYFATRGIVTGRKKAVSISIAFPFVCVAYAGLWFAAYAEVNDSVFDRDPSFGDLWKTPIPNGYEMEMIDTTDQGTIYSPKRQDGSVWAPERGDVVYGVRQLQVSKNLIFGARDKDYTEHFGQESKSVNAYFELNAAKKTHKEFKSLEELRQEAASEGIELQLREFDAVFRDYRTTWFDRAAPAILLLVPLVALLVLARWVWKIRVTGQTCVGVGG